MAGRRQHGCLDACNVLTACFYDLYLIAWFVKIFIVQKMDEWTDTKVPREPAAPSPWILCVGVTIVVIFFAMVVCCCCCCRKKRSKETSS